MLFLTFIYFKPKSYRPIERCEKLPALYFTWTIFRELIILRPFGIEFRYACMYECTYECMHVCMQEQKKKISDIYTHI